MKQYILTAFFATLVFVGVASAQQARPILGGYKDISTENSEVRRAADAAVSSEAKRSKKEIELIEIIKAEHQNVRSSNYRMCLKINTEGAEGQDAAEVFVKAIVNVDLKGVAKLTSWEASDCGEPDEPATVGFTPSKTYKQPMRSFQWISIQI